MKKTFKKLKPATRRWVKAVQESWQLDEHHDRLLILAAAAWDRAVEAKAIIDKDGSIILDRFEQKKSHPAVEIERQSMITFSRLLRELGLDLISPEDSRPLTYRPGNY
jgi:phage terminase small subunit